MVGFLFLATTPLSLQGGISLPSPVLVSARGYLSPATLNFVYIKVTKSNYKLVKYLKTSSNICWVHLFTHNVI